MIDPVEAMKAAAFLMYTNTGEGQQEYKRGIIDMTTMLLNLEPEDRGTVERILKGMQ